MAGRATFHHGSLKTALVDRALEEIERVGSGELSLRDLAEQLDVSRSAPYRHFGTKRMLLAELAAWLQRELLARHSSIPADLSAEQRLRAAGQQYLELAAARPRLFQLVFADDAFWLGGSGMAGASSPPAYGLFQKIVAAAAGPGLPSSAIRLRALCCWSMLHGYAMLRMTGRLAGFAGGDDTEAQVLEMVTAVATASPDISSV